MPLLSTPSSSCSTNILRHHIVTRHHHAILGAFRTRTSRRHTALRIPLFEQIHHVEEQKPPKQFTSTLTSGNTSSIRTTSTANTLTGRQNSPASCRAPSSHTMRTPPLLTTLLLPLLMSLLLLTPTSSANFGLDPKTLSHEPYQYFHSDGVGGANAACWLSRTPFPTLDGLTCRLAETISQVKGRQIWLCDGDHGKFCDGCHELEKRLTGPKELVQWKVQGC